MKKIGQFLCSIGLHKWEKLSDVGDMCSRKECDRARMPHGLCNSWRIISKGTLGAYANRSKRMPVAEWLQTIEDKDVRRNAIRNCMEFWEGEMQDTSSLHDALSCAFVFSKSPEGYDYWYEVLNSIRLAERSVATDADRKIKS